MRTLPRLAVGVAVVFTFAACGGSGDGSGGDSPAPTAPSGDRPASTAKLSIVEPKIGQVITGSTVDLRVKLEDAKIVPATTTNIVPDEGHLHVILDEKLISMTEGLEQKIRDVPPGAHRIEVEFVASDHVPFDPRVVAVVAFEVRP